MTARWRNRARRWPSVVAALVLAGGSLALAAPALAQAPATPHFTDVPADLSQGRVLVVRPGRLELYNRGLLQMWYSIGRSLELGQLPDLVRQRAYVSAPARGVVRLQATLAARPGVTLTASAPALRRIELADAGAGPARLAGTSSSIRFTGVEVTSLASGRGGPRAAGALDFNRSSVTLTGVTLRGPALPAPVATPAPGASPPATARAGLVVTGGRVAISDSRVTGGGDGIRISQASSLALHGVTAAGTGGTGIFIRGPLSGSIDSLAASGCGGDGVVLDGIGPRVRVAGPLSAAGNARNGVVVSDLSALSLPAAATSGNGGSGVRLLRVKSVVLSGSRSEGDRTGVSVQSSTGVTLSGLTVTGAGTGVGVAASSAVSLAGLRITATPPQPSTGPSTAPPAGPGADGAAQPGAATGQPGAAAATGPGAAISTAKVGLRLSGAGLRVADTITTGADEGLLIEGDARDVHVQGGRYDATRVAARVDATTPTTLSGVTLHSAAGSALLVTGRGLSLEGASLAGAQGITVRGVGSGLAVLNTTVEADGSAVDTGTQTGAIAVDGGRLAGRSGPALTLGGAGVTLKGTTIVSGAGEAAAIDLHARLTADGISVRSRGTGLRLTGTATATIHRSSIAAAEAGVYAGPRTTARLIDTDLNAGQQNHGPLTVIGDNHLSHEPLRWQAVAVLAAVGSALVLEILRRLRERGRTAASGAAPDHVLNSR